MGIKALYLLRPYLSDIEILRSQVITGSLHVRLCVVHDLPWLGIKLIEKCFITFNTSVHT